MTSQRVKKEDIVEAIESLPPEQLVELSEFIAFLRFKAEERPRRLVKLGGQWKDFTPEPAESVLRDTFDTWQDRTDMPNDGVEYVREMRSGQRLDMVMERPDEAD